jgi:hypothetical protein
VRTGLGRFAECVLALSLVAGLGSCSEADSQPGISVTPVASSPAPSRTASPTPSAGEQNLREAEAAVLRFWRVIDRLSKLLGDVSSLRCRLSRPRCQQRPRIAHQR